MTGQPKPVAPEVDLDELEARCSRDWCRVPCSKDELRALIAETRAHRAAKQAPSYTRMIAAAMPPADWTDNLNFGHSEPATAKLPPVGVVTREHRERARVVMGVEFPASRDYDLLFIDDGSDPGKVYPITARVAQAIADAESRGAQACYSLLETSLGAAIAAAEARGRASVADTELAEAERADLLEDLAIVSHELTMVDDYPLPSSQGSRDAFRRIEAFIRAASKGDK